MNLGDRRLRFAHTLQKVMRESSNDTTDLRPATGFVGQRSLGYIQDKNGQLFMIKPEIKSEDMIGPGTYNPYKYERFGGKAVLSRNSKRTDFAKSEFKVGPADHVSSFKSTRIQHKFGPDDRSQIRPPEKIQPPLSGELAHESWIKEPPKIPKNRFPQIKFVEQKSRPFASKVTRELFSGTRTQTPGPGNYEHDIVEEVQPEEESYSIFKNRQERFQDATSFTPSPCAYTLPTSMGKGPAFSLNPLMDDAIKKTQDETPSPGQYEVEPVKVVVKNKSRPERRYHSVLGDNPKRRKPPKERMPSVGTYNIAEQELTDTIPRIIQSIRYNQAYSWIQNKDTPGPGSYNPKSSKSRKSTTLNTTCHPKKPDFDRYQDSNLAFTTLHGDFIIKSSNKHYNKDLEHWK